MPAFAEGDLIELDEKLWTVAIVHLGASYESGRALLDPSYYILSSVESVQEVRMGKENTIYIPRRVTAPMHVADREAKLVRAAPTPIRPEYGTRRVRVQRHRRRR